MASKYQVTKGSEIFVTEKPYVDNGDNTYISLGCLLTEVSYTGGAKSDIEVTTLCSTTKEQTNGLPDPGEVTFSGNWVANDEALLIMRAAYNNNATHGFKIQFPDDPKSTPPLVGGGYTFQGQVRQENFSIAPDAVVTGGFTVRMIGLMEEIKSGS